MDPEKKSDEEAKPGGIPLKASKGGGSSIRMTRSREAGENPNEIPETMSDEEKKPAQPAEKSSGGEKPKPKLPPKKTGGGLPNPGEMKAKTPPSAPAESGDEAEKSEEGQGHGGLPSKKAAPAQPAAKGGDESADEKKAAVEAIKKGEPGDEEADDSPAEESSPRPQVGPSGAKPGGAKPKLTPKIPPKPKPKPASPEQSARPGTGAAAGQEPQSAESAEPAKKSAKPPPPKPHVVRPGAAKKQSQPTQGGAAVPTASRTKKSDSVSAVGLGIDVVAFLAALAVGYLVLSDLLKIL